VHHEAYSSSHGCARGAAPRSQNLALGRAAVRAQPARSAPACGRGSGTVRGPGSLPRPASRLRARLHPPDAAHCRGARSKKPRGPTKDEKNALAKAGAAVAAVAAVALGGYFIYKVRPAIPAAPSAAGVVSEQRGGARCWCVHQADLLAPPSRTALRVLMETCVRANAEREQGRRLRHGARDRPRHARGQGQGRPGGRLVQPQGPPGPGRLGRRRAQRPPRPAQGRGALPPTPSRSMWLRLPCNRGAPCPQQPAARAGCLQGGAGGQRPGQAACKGVQAPERGCCNFRAPLGVLTLQRPCCAAQDKAGHKADQAVNALKDAGNRAQDKARGRHAPVPVWL